MSTEWAAEEMRSLKLKDQRLKKRMQKILQDFSERPGQSVPGACQGNWAATKAVYAFWDHPQVDEAAIRQAHYQATKKRVTGQQRILAVQDTTDLNYTGKQVAAEMGHLASDKIVGLMMHSVLAVSEQGLPLGLLDQLIWSRDPQTKGKRHQRRQKPTSEKESQRWLDGLQAAEAMTPEGVEVIHVADREGDIFDLFALERRPNSQLLIRMEYNRRVESEARYLWDTVRQSPLRGEYWFDVPTQRDRPTRSAHMTLRYAQVTLRPPAGRAADAVTLQFVLVEEIDAPPEVEAVIWLLATSLPVESVADAMLCVRYYSYRWLIERFHFVLKSGCRMEKLYLQTKARILRALATFSIVAWRLLWLTYQARLTPQAPCSIILQPHEWQALYCTLHHTPTPPDHPPSFQDAVRWIARLGGFLGRKNDGDPGPMTIWRGLRRLDDIAATWRLLHLSPPH